VELSNNKTLARAAMRLEIEVSDRFSGKASTLSFVENARAPFTRCVAPLSMLNLALISSAARTLTAPIRSKPALRMDCTFREIPARDRSERPGLLRARLNIQYMFSRMLRAGSAGAPVESKQIGDWAV